MIQARTQQQMTPEEENAVRKFFSEHPELGDGASDQQMQNANVFEDYIKRWNVVVDAESLEQAYINLLAVEGVLKITSAVQLKWEQASKLLPPHVLVALDQGMRQCHLVTDGDEGFENKTNLLGYLQGREISTATISRAAEYCGGRGVQIHWQDRPRQNAPETRGHGHIPGERWMPKEETNRSFYPSHASNPKFNGEEDRKKMQRMRPAEPDPAFAHNFIWKQAIEKAVAEGRTHTERARIAQAAQQTPGGPRLQAEAAQKEVALIRQDRARGR